MRLEHLSAAYNLLGKSITDPAVADWYVDQLHKNVTLENAKSKNYALFNQLMLSSKTFTSVSELATLLRTPVPFVVKFDASLVGIQTVVVNDQSGLKQVYKVMETLGCSQGIVQQFVTGQEYTVTVLVGKTNWVTLGTACDYKKQFDNNSGLNTFGLGSTAPCPNVHPDTDKIIDHVVDVLRVKFDYLGPLSCQFIVDSRNNIWLLEHNTRLCDPEFQSTAELADLSTALVQCSLGQHIDQPAIKNKQAITIGLVHQDWPTPQDCPAEIELAHPKFKILRNHGTWSKNLYWGSITHSGTESYAELAEQVYQWLDQQNVWPYRYRRDIGQ